MDIQNNILVEKQQICVYYWIAIEILLSLYHGIA